MRTDRLILYVVTLAFLDLTLAAVFYSSWQDIVDIFTSRNWWTWQLMADFLISLTLVTLWIVRDARRRGRSPWPWVALVLATGSLGPLIYLIARGRRSALVPEAPLPA